MHWPHLKHRSSLSGQKKHFFVFILLDYLVRTNLGTQAALLAGFLCNGYWSHAVFSRIACHHKFKNMA
jgi:hypothetical protein